MNWNHRKLHLKIYGASLISSSILVTGWHFSDSILMLWRRGREEGLDRYLLDGEDDRAIWMDGNGHKKDKI
jgi:hypothetical protein